MISTTKIAVVTGASTGLGQSISIKLALKKYKVVLASRDQKKLNYVQKEINKKGGKSQVVVTDISKEDDIKKLYSQIDINRVDVVVNNAGFGIFNKIQKISSKEWDMQIDTN